MMKNTQIVTAIATALALLPAATFAQGTQPAQTAPTGPVLQLSMKQAEAMALESNLGLKSDRLGPDIASENLAAARSAFLPAVESGFTRSSSERATSSVFEGGASTLTTKGLGGNARIRQSLPWYGASYALNYSVSRSESTDLFAKINPSLSSNLSITFIQPLWEGFRTDFARTGIRSAERGRAIADIQLEQQMVLMRVRVQNAYLNLLFAIENLNVSQQNLELARETLRNNKSRVEVGTVAPIEIVQAEAEVASNEEGVILGESQVSTAEDALRALIFDPARPDYWQVKIEPTDSIQSQATDVNVDAAIANALANRTDLIIAKRQLELADLNIDLLHNQINPTVDLVATYQASGSGGTLKNFDNSQFPPVLSSSVERGLGVTLAESFKNNLPSWSVGFTASYPIGKSGTEANLARARLEKQRSEIQLRDAELQVSTAVRDAGRQVSTGAKRVQVTQLAREAAQKQLDAEQKRFDLGLSSTFQLSLRQRDLASAKLRELQAIIGYTRSLITFEAIQKAPVR
jgi:outer membrane protein